MLLGVRLREKQPRDSLLFLSTPFRLITTLTLAGACGIVVNHYLHDSLRLSSLSPPQFHC